ncbi:MAG: efflux RND transporter periplasmic adaptor subunit [Patescibacteria group bacterium]|nr:efflux RND transporter periplasmic adaptor subunit [Patescibacteria group bacterium]
MKFSAVADVRSALSPRQWWRYAAAHKLITAIVLVAVLGSSYWLYGNLTPTSGQTTYVLGTVQKATVVESVSESGQVAATNSISLTPKVSGEITWVGIKAGDHITAGQALMTIDNTTALQSVASAEATLRTSQLQYQQDSAQAPFTYQNDLNTLQTDQDTLATAYADSYNSITTTFLDLPASVSGMTDAVYGYEMSTNKSQWNVDVLLNLPTSDTDRLAMQPFTDKAKADYQTADTAYNAALTDYQSLSRSSSTTAIYAMLQESVTMTTAVAQALQAELNAYGKASDIATADNLPLPAAFSTLQTNTRNYLSTVNNDLNALLAQKKTLDSDIQAVKNDENTITLLQVGNPSGANPISLQISSSSLASQEQNLTNLQQQLSYYTISAPFSGTVSSVAVQKGDNAGGSLATIVTDNQIATLSLNEVDVAKIALGDKVTLTFDAIPNLTLTGTVAGIDAVGTVSQGVVSYNVQVNFAAQNAAVKPGMTVNANIETGVAQDVLTVPSSAIKTQGGTSYVMVFTPPLANTGGTTGIVSATAPTMVPVTTGLSDGTNTEITSGLTEGEQVVVRTSGSAATVSAAAAATSRTGGGGFRGGAGGAQIFLRGG